MGTTNDRDEEIHAPRRGDRRRGRDCRTADPVARSARNRLQSIRRDASFLGRVVAALRRPPTGGAAASAVTPPPPPPSSGWPVLCNERCGSWYGYAHSDGSCYFKSTDGHVGTWAFSLKRLNLGVLSAASSSGGCLIVDSSKSKALPDSLSRTIPIWAAVLNRTALRFARERSGRDLEGWDVGPHLPPSVPDEERRSIECRLDGHVSALVACGAVDPGWFLDTVRRPLRPYWIANDAPAGRPGDLALPEYRADRYTVIVCVSCSEGPSGRKEQEWKGGTCEGGERFAYTPGAADDHEAWSRGLTPGLFWSNASALLEEAKSAMETDRAIDRIVAAARGRDEEWYQQGGGEAAAADVNTPTGDRLPPPRSCNALGSSFISIGTRRSGRPPDCWDRFNAVLNVTGVEYESLETGEGVPPGNAYLQLPVREGKRDRSELERWMAVGLAFVALNAAAGRRVLIHCAQGRDRSAAVAMAAVVLFCGVNGGARGELELQPWCRAISLLGLERYILGEKSEEDVVEHRRSGMSGRLVEALLGRGGRHSLLGWIRKLLGQEDGQTMLPLATKESLRLALHTVRRYHDRACPTRSTMQKLHRFFMSEEFEGGNHSRG